MRNQQIARRRSVLVKARTLTLIATLAAFPFLATRVAAEQSATVATEQLYVRRGPGSEFPPFATLGRGDRVEVHEVRGEWARIITGNGQTGYVRSDFLSLRADKPAEPQASPAAASDVPAAPTSPTKTGKPTRTPTATKKPKATATPSPERPTATPRLTATTALTVTPRLTATVRWTPTARGDIASAAAATPPPTSTPALTPELTATTVPASAASVPVAAAADNTLLERLRVEVARLTLAVEELRRRMDTQPSIDGPLPVGSGNGQGAPSGWAMAFAFGIIGALVGWILGASVGRRQERSQRSRIRF